MPFLDFREKMRDFPYFSTRDLEIVLNQKITRSFLNNLKNWEKRNI